MKYTMPKLELTVEQAVDLIKQMPLEAKYAIIQSFNEERDRWWQKTLLEGEQQMRQLTAERGLDWDQMSESERERFIDDLVHES